jgi:Xaa-Pro dipeptidase
MESFAERRARVYQRMKEEGIGLLMFEDGEGRRDPSLRYLCGQPADALLFLFAEGRCVLVPWDVNMARSLARADEILPLTDFGRRTILALSAMVERAKANGGGAPRVELPTATTHLDYLEYSHLPGCETLVLPDGIHSFLTELRAVKDARELEIIERACAVTDEVALMVEDLVRSKPALSELDVALFIEREARLRGAEGLGFETLAAGPSRSFGIHAFPPFTASAFGTRGLSILDFGLKFEGYTSDVTWTFARGPLSEGEEETLRLVQGAYDAAAALLRPGVRARDVALAVDAHFAAAGRSMPHALGHGIGLEAHEAPTLRSREDNDWTLERGMVFTLEPGLYDVELGGARLEDDWTFDAEGNPRKLTHSRIVRVS